MLLNNLPTSSHDSQLTEIETAAQIVGAGDWRRRKFVRAALLLAGGLPFMAPMDGWSFLNRSRTSGTAAGGGSAYRPGRVVLPQEWIRILGPQAVEYAEFLRRLNLRQIRVEQIIEPHLKKRGTVQNTIPPKRLWRSIRPTLLAADAVARRMNEPVREIISAYRSPAYNARCPGARSNSYHVQNMALDLQFSSSPRTVAKVARELRDRGLFQGGIGRYSSFTHIDTRNRRADW
jgi:hypothetical protein